MLDYLVTSSVRRRLMELLWGHDAMGTVSQLAERGDVAYAAAYRELKEMQRLGLVTSTVDRGPETYRAAAKHPDAELLRRLVATRPRMTMRREDDDDMRTRRRLRALGTPLPVEPATVAPDEHEQVLIEGVALARRDPTVASVLPVAFWRQRDRVDRQKLEEAARRAKQKHATGFMLALTSELAGDRKLARAAEHLRDHRVSRPRPFFQLPTTRSAARSVARRTPPLAREWGYTLDLDLDTFRSQFEKFTADEAV